MLVMCPSPSNIMWVQHLLWGGSFIKLVTLPTPHAPRAPRVHPACLLTVLWPLVLYPGLDPHV